MPAPIITTSDIDLLLDSLEPECHHFAAVIVLTNVRLKPQFQPDFESVDGAVDGREHAQALGQFHQSQTKGHERIGTLVITGGAVAHHREAPQHPASAES